MVFYTYVTEDDPVNSIATVCYLLCILDIIRSLRSDNCPWDASHSLGQEAVMQEVLVLDWIILYFKPSLTS